MREAETKEEKVSGGSKPWPDYFEGQVVQGLKESVRGRIGTVVSKKPKVSSFDHKWVDVKWDDSGETESVRTLLLAPYSR